MKAVLEFSLPEDDEEYMGAVKGPRLRYACGEFAAWMHRRLKDDTYKENGTKELEEVKAMFWEMCGDYLAE